MSLLLRYSRHHWPALLVLGLMVWRLGRESLDENAVLWICTGLSALGIALNLIVIYSNGGMPAAVSPEDIDEEDRPYYHPIHESTRLRLLSDWIPWGDWMISPGDVLLWTALAILVLRAILGVSV